MQAMCIRGHPGFLVIVLEFRELAMDLVLTVIGCFLCIFIQYFHIIYLNHFPPTPPRPSTTLGHPTLCPSPLSSGTSKPRTKQVKIRTNKTKKTKKKNQQNNTILTPYDVVSTPCFSAPSIVCFVLTNHSQAWDLPWSIVDLPADSSLPWSVIDLPADSLLD